MSSHDINIDGKDYIMEIFKDGNDMFESIQLTECGDPDAIEMLEAVDFKVVS